MVSYRFNSTFKVKPGTAKMKRGAMKRSSSLKRSPMKKSRRPMKKVGRRTKDWRKAWRFLKAEFDKRGRKGCEFKFIPHECWGPLDPAHSKKRSKMKGNDVYMVALACRMIHNFIDYECAHEDMELFVLHAIDLAGGPIIPETRTTKMNNLVDEFLRETFPAEIRGLKSQKVVTVCDKCFTELCFSTSLKCEESGSAGSITDTEENIAAMFQCKPKETR